MPDIRPPDNEASYEKNAIRKIQREMAERILQELNLSSKSFVLDVGCGSGFSMEVIESNVFGIDISQELLLAAKRKRIKNIVRADFRQIPFKSESFDAILSVSAIQWFEAKDEHDVKEHYLQIAKEFFRCLKKGGKAGLQFYPATEKEWEISVKQFRKLFEGYIIEEGAGRKKKKYIILKKE